MSQQFPRISLWRPPSLASESTGYHIAADPTGYSKLSATLLVHQHANQLLRAHFELTPPPPGMLSAGEKPSGVIFQWLELVTDPAFTPAHLVFTEDRGRCTIEFSKPMASAAYLAVDGLLRGTGGDQLRSTNATLVFWEHPTD
jgi:hypothetical protein